MGSREDHCSNRVGGYWRGAHFTPRSQVESGMGSTGQGGRLTRGVVNRTSFFTSLSPFRNCQHQRGRKMWTRGDSHLEARPANPPGTLMPLRSICHCSPPHRPFSPQMAEAHSGTGGVGIAWQLEAGRERGLGRTPCEPLTPPPSPSRLPQKPTTAASVFPPGPSQNLSLGRRWVGPRSTASPLSL